MAARKSAGKKKSPAGQLRIVAGNWRSRLLTIADVNGLRPTAERIRETLFNWLEPDVHGSRCLDLCAGTGALGLEALSRGALEAVFVESSAVAVKVLRANAESLSASGAEILHEDAREFLGRAVTRPFDIVFLDPPFKAELHDELCRLLQKQNWLAANGKIYIESDKDQPEVKVPVGWRILNKKTAGNVCYMLAIREV
jgi:16S rRNA (guanine966-N2)-methyltransferase